jgi:hypothetical protein
MFDT